MDNQPIFNKISIINNNFDKKNLETKRIERNIILENKDRTIKICRTDSLNNNIYCSREISLINDEKMSKHDLLSKKLNSTSKNTKELLRNFKIDEANNSLKHDQFFKETKIEESKFDLQEKIKNGYIDFFKNKEELKNNKTKNQDEDEKFQNINNKIEISSSNLNKLVKVPESKNSLTENDCETEQKLNCKGENFSNNEIEGGIKNEIELKFMEKNKIKTHEINLSLNLENNNFKNNYCDLNMIKKISDIYSEKKDNANYSSQHVLNLENKLEKSIKNNICAINDEFKKIFDLNLKEEICSKKSVKNISNFMKIEEIGEGAYGRVCKFK